MPIIRGPDEDWIGLEDFYQQMLVRDQEQFGEFASSMGCGRQMLDLLARINKLFRSTTLWGGTSLGWLIIRPENSASGSLHDLIRIVNTGPESYSIQYLLPAAVGPWPFASVHGEAQDATEAERYLLIAMRASGGWADNSELAALLEGYGLRG